MHLDSRHQLDERRLQDTLLDGMEGSVSWCNLAHGGPYNFTPSPKTIAITNKE